MANILEVKTVHSGYLGSPGYTQHYFQSTVGAQVATSVVRNFWEGVASQFAGNWRYSISPEVPEFDDTSGTLIAINATTPATQSTFGGSANVAAGVGACASWITSGVVGTRKVRGRTFLVPLNADAYDSDGTLNGISLPQLRSAAAEFADGNGLVVWHRPTDGTDGGAYVVEAGTVKDQVAYLSSRRT